MQSCVPKGYAVGEKRIARLTRTAGIVGRWPTPWHRAGWHDGNESSETTAAWFGTGGFTAPASLRQRPSWPGRLQDALQIDINALVGLANLGLGPLAQSIPRAL
jgi:hypothetical protein